MPRAHSTDKEVGLLMAPLLESGPLVSTRVPHLTPVRTQVLFLGRIGTIPLDQGPSLPETFQAEVMPELCQLFQG